MARTRLPAADNFRRVVSSCTVHGRSPTDHLLLLRLQADLEQAADGFGAAGLVILADGPIVDVRQQLAGDAQGARWRFPFGGRPRFLGVAVLIDFITS
jgi:hypothetical protein